jgi:hypothetical protein
MRLSILAGVLAGAAFSFGFAASAQATPLSISRSGAEAASCVEAPVVEAVTRAGVAHRSARRTARRVNRRHSYY